MPGGATRGLGAYLAGGRVATYGVLVTASDDGLQSLIELRQKLGSLVSGLTHGDGFCGKAEESFPHKLSERGGYTLRDSVGPRVRT